MRHERLAKELTKGELNPPLELDWWRNNGDGTYQGSRMIGHYTAIPDHLLSAGCNPLLVHHLMSLLEKEIKSIPLHPGQPVETGIGVANTLESCENLSVYFAYVTPVLKDGNGFYFIAYATPDNGWNRLG